MTIDNKYKLLIGLALILAAILIYRLVNPFQQPTVSKLTYGRTNKIATPSSQTAPGDDPGPPSKAMAHLLEAPQALPAAVFRDPFRRPAEKDNSRPIEPAPPQPPPQVATPDERAREQLGRFKAFGSFRQNGRESLFLQRGKQIMVVKLGDLIDGRFKIEALEGRTVTVSTTGDPQPFEFQFDELKAGSGGGIDRSLSSLTERTSKPAPASRAPDFNEEVPPEDESENDSLPEPELDANEDLPPEDESRSDWNVLPTPQNRKTTDATPNRSLSQPLPLPASNSDRFIPDREID
jgi:hypothetical protein